MEETYEALLELQQLDDEMRQAEDQLQRFEPELEELDAPVRKAEEEVEAVRKRLEEMRAELRRLERGAEDKRAQLVKYEDRLTRVKTSREEAAAKTELDLIRGAVEADEDDAMSLMEQVTRAELKLDELEKRLGEVRSETDPKRQELLKGREEAESALAVLADRRQNQLVRMDNRAAKMYEQIRGGRARAALAALTPDGACGNCFGMIPLQERNEIRRREALYRCEACGVILYPPEE